MSRYYLLLSIFVSLNGSSQPQPTIIRDGKVTMMYDIAIASSYVYA